MDRAAIWKLGCSESTCPETPNPGMLWCAGTETMRGTTDIAAYRAIFRSRPRRAVSDHWWYGLSSDPPRRPNPALTPRQHFGWRINRPERGEDLHPGNAGPRTVTDSWSHPYWAKSVRGMLLLR